MSYKDLGALLRKQREKRGLTIEDVAQRLKIMPRQLTALEEGDVEALPHMAYAKGFIRSYATFLGISKEEAQEALEGEKEPEDAKKGKNSKAPETAVQKAATPEPAKVDAKSAEEEKPAADSRPKQAEKKTEPVALPTREIGREEIPFPAGSKRKSGGKGLVFLILLCVIAGGGYWAWSEGYFDPWLKKATDTDVAANLPRADEYMAEKDASQARKTASAPEYKPEIAPAPIFETSPTNPAKEILDQKVPPEPAASNKESTQPLNVPPKPATADDEPREPHNLIITAIEECWVHSNADKTDTRQFSLRKGDTFALSFSNSLELKLGNAGGVRLRYDGAELPPPGTSGQVKTIVFPQKTPDGME